MPAPVLKVPESNSPVEWEAYSSQRNCYCRIWATGPAMYEERGLPRGFCGTCERCGKPGHLRHFPGPVPYTGAWCDRCHVITALTWPFYTLIGWIYIAIAVGILWFVVQVAVRVMA
jgi:hypothetical protein